MGGLDFFSFSFFWGTCEACMHVYMWADVAAVVVFFSSSLPFLSMHVIVSEIARENTMDRYLIVQLCVHCSNI